MFRKIDQLDRKILVELSRDSRQSFRSLARKMRVSIATAIHRVKNLEEAGIIKGYTAKIDAEKLGYDLTAVIEVSVSKGKLVEVERQIAVMDKVTAVYDITGLTDSIIIARFENRKALNTFVKSLLGLEFVEHTNTRIVLNTVKEDLGLPKSFAQEK
jgi:DNA-binding Lrp family transcriptional regulator